jgi:hypothetical protein
MSLKYEQYRALVRTRNLLRDILCNKAPTRKKELRAEAGSCLKHFPFLDERGAPIFSQDPFECPVINKGVWGDD